MNETTELYSTYVENLLEMQKRASGRTKSAADEEALRMKDPADQGTPSIPGCLTSENRKNLGMPADGRNENKTEDQLSRLSTVTNPAGVGQGSYITPSDGDAKDAKATSPTAPLDKIAQFTMETLRSSGNYQLPQQIDQDLMNKIAAQQQQSTTMEKLACFGIYLAATQEGREAALTALAQDNGIEFAKSFAKEAAVIEEAFATQAQAQLEAQAELQKQAAAQYNQQPSLFAKNASEQIHEAMLNNCHNEMEKFAYARGVADADYLLKSAAMGAPEPEIPGENEISAEDVQAIIDQAVQSGDMTPEEAQQVTQLLNADGDLGGDAAQIGQELQAAVQSGQISEEDANVIAQLLLAQIQGGGQAADPSMMGGAPEGAADPAMMGGAPEGAVDPAMAEAVVKGASVLNALYGN